MIQNGSRAADYSSGRTQVKVGVAANSKTFNHVTQQGGTMPRLKQVPRDAAPPQVQQIYDFVFGAGRDPVAEPGTETGTPGNWWTVFALVPDALTHAVAGFAFYRSKSRLLDPKLRELGQTRAGWARGS